jgi:hypothetical protein
MSLRKGGASMRRGLKRAVLAALLMTPLAGCFVKERTVACPPATTQVASSGCVWVQAYRDGQGRVHAAHWRCPGTIDAN